MTGIPEDFVHLDGFLLPDEFWPAFGYEGQARFVGLFWTPFGDEAIYTDGRVEADGNWPAYAMLMDHPANAELLRYPCWLCQGRGTTNDLENEPCEECFGVGTLEYNLGSSEFQATHMLIADREQRQVYIAPRWAGEQFLRERWPLPELLTATETYAVMEAICQAMSEMEIPTRRKSSGPWKRPRSGWWHCDKLCIPLFLLVKMAAKSQTWKGQCAQCGSPVRGGGERYRPPAPGQQVMCLICLSYAKRFTDEQQLDDKAGDSPAASDHCRGK